MFLLNSRKYIINLVSDHNIKVDFEYKKRTAPLPHSGFHKLSNKKFQIYSQKLIYFHLIRILTIISKSVS
jgi:hypothetical protein